MLAAPISGSMRGMDEGDGSTSKAVGALTWACGVYGFVWLTLMWTGWGPVEFQEPGPWRTAGVVLFYLAWLELLLSGWLHRRATKPRRQQTTQ
jgi:hypothetical protein